ncbi:MAG: hypothetical protein A2900_03485 [Candidatus Chisholmbacteria bacterium RIFCSPLOWO2_01_FULL_50_28]|uniref:TspO protein n=1 Tax=Candidatus Chisholmbacteria bacterium RIFCSPHIGHO2_01_FULL_52_32 TaxID=1797591 RepID=A0A1G1VT05_9BACT|nr:MAG: hypothetical protein A2786_03260 [Candidatus Chisholmbacteria bacterium RIFCSPHIGHO2_01_FULL_52_32]OGY20139.1 MAG: hypothetical protein A2900_03485 [Candidatus Chisholmbacteria bacterium RIFCSPLOWO2_01_FULL_50_28]
MKKYTPLLISLGIAFGVAFLGSSVTTPSISGWYASLNKPSFNPPAWVFAPVWTILFAMMAIASFLVWKKQKKMKIPLQLYGIQLFLNFLWSFLFFGLRRPDLALLEIALLWIVIQLTLRAFYAVDKLASYLLVPYILWVSFAAFINFSIVLLN